CDRRRLWRRSVIVIARRTLVCRSSASAEPRSPNTFPELCMILSSRSFRAVAISIFVVLPRQFQAMRDEFHVRFRRLHAVGRLLLKTVRYVNSPLKPHGIDGAVRVSVVSFHDLQNTRAVPTLSLTASGNPSKFLVDEPTQYSGTSP